SGDGDSLKLLSISGSAMNDDDKKLKEIMKPVLKWQEKNSKIYEAAFKAKDKVLMDSLDEVDFEVMYETRKVVAAFVKQNPNSIRGALSIKQNFSYYAEAADMEPIYAFLDEKIKKSKLGEELNKMIATYRTVAIGMKAPEIVQNTPDGKRLSLSSLQGKFVLIDFWASWCGPCRRENPNLVKIFNEHKSKGFTIYGVSYDTKKDSWEKAIQDDGLAWSQVSDLKGGKNSTSEQYGIRAIPSNLILDKEGTIIAKNLFGKKLAAKLAEIFLATNR
ncbi:MAG: TlpA disulfide reductase family protein, partial [Chitinophagaceae bacterium]